MCRFLLPHTGLHAAGAHEDLVRNRAAENEFGKMSLEDQHPNKIHDQYQLSDQLSVSLLGPRRFIQQTAVTVDSPRVHH